MQRKRFFFGAFCVSLTLALFFAGRPTLGQETQIRLIAPEDARQGAPSLVAPSEPVAVPREPVVVPSDAVAAPSDAADWLRRGYVFERERRWGEALTHYENGLRRFPEDGGLRRRFDFARLHYDVGRRYNDRSFRQGLSQFASTQVLDLYGEVLTKIRTHYIDAPQWKELVEAGVQCLEIALSEPAFLASNAPNVQARDLDAFRRELRGTLGPRVIQTREDARAAAALAANLASERLGLAHNAVLMEFLCGASNSLDQYSTFLTPDQWNEVHSQIKGNFVGLGIELKAKERALVIERVIPNSPAKRAGIAVGDRITSIDGRNLADFSADGAANLLQGEAGTAVELVVLSPDGKNRTVNVRRERVEVPSIEDAKIIDPAQGVAYLRLTGFQETTFRDLDSSLWALHRDGMRTLIIDLRGNPGGLLISAVEAADLFLERGVIVSTHGRGAHEDFTYAAREAGTWRVPLVVLIDQDSASAAEIFAGAIRDHRRGAIVGVRSYGKGSVQSIIPTMSGNCGLRLTTAKFYSPTNKPYSGVGVLPDIVVHRTARPVGSSGQWIAPNDDPMLDAALQAAQRTVAKRQP